MIVTIDSLALAKACDTFMSSQLADDCEIFPKSMYPESISKDDLDVEQAIRDSITTYLEQVSK